MPIRGPKPKSAQQRRAEGNPGKRPIPETVEMGGLPPTSPEPPDHLDADGKRWWNEAIPILHAVGILDVVDTAALEMAATAYSRYRGAKRVLDTQGTLSRGSTGQLTEHPACGTERQAQAMYLRFAEQYALTPVARTRLGLAELHRRSMAEEMTNKLGKPALTAVG